MDDERNAIGKNIRILRKEKGLTQKALSKKTGIAEITIRQYEAGKYIPKYDNMLKLAIALNVSTREILSYDNMIGDIDPTGDIVYERADILEYNRIISKQKSGDGFTPYDIRFISDFIKDNPLIREWFVVNGLKSQEKNLHHIQDSYEHLNDEGRKEAAKRIEELTEIERYTKPEEWFKGRPTKEEIDKAVTAYLNDDNPDEPPQE
jgi:transcriptional regulator with XRE-family HTH domain